MGDVIRTERLELVLMSPAFIEALLAGRRAEAAAEGGFAVPDGWPDPHDAHWLKLRLGQMREDPATAVWLGRAIVLPDAPGRPMIGHIGFHGPPHDGAAEMGYTVFPEHRRRGVAHEAAQGMMRWARETAGVQRFILSISPENAPSLGMAAKMGFRRTGEQMDEEDGLEWVFEREA